VLILIELLEAAGAAIHTWSKKINVSPLAKGKRVMLPLLSSVSKPETENHCHGLLFMTMG